MKRNRILLLLTVIFFTIGQVRLSAEKVKQFTLSFSLELTSTTPCKLLEIPNVLSVNLIDGQSLADDGGQNYAAFPMKDGTVSVLEASLRLRQPVGKHELNDMKIGVPLALLPNPLGRHAVELVFTGARWTLYVDGKLMDNDFPLGYPESSLTNPDYDANKVSEVTLSPKGSVRERAERNITSSQLQYFTPQGHNAWVGDVATCYYKGRYHLFYLYDRRGHRSKFGRGGHYFEHLSTADFRTWTEHPEATPIEEQWETFGTGTPFVWHDSLFLSYGMHTTRIYPQEVTASPMQWQYIRDHGESRAITFKSIEGLFPSGASYSVASPDGSRFTKTHVLFHPSENPTMYTDEQGRLMMLANYGARGMWTSDRIEGGWRCLSEDFPPGGDCTFIFHWGDYDYIVGGFTHMWMKEAAQPIEGYVDMVAQGTDFYDGLSVPAFTRLPSDRVIMAGWVQINKHWGGTLVIRELLQDKDGRIGSRFMDETMPPFKKPRQIANQINSRRELSLSSSSGLLTFDVTAISKDGKLDLTFLPERGTDEAFTWTIDLGEQRTQFSPSSQQRQKTLREGGKPQAAEDYAIDHLGTDLQSRTFPVRIILNDNPKLRGTLVDIEIAGRRTMISYRHKLLSRRIVVQPHQSKVTNLKFASL